MPVPLPTSTINYFYLLPFALMRFISLQPLILISRTQPQIIIMTGGHFREVICSPGSIITIGEIWSNIIKHTCVLDIGAWDRLGRDKGEIGRKYSDDLDIFL